MNSPNLQGRGWREGVHTDTSTVRDLHSQLRTQGEHRPVSTQTSASAGTWGAWSVKRRSLDFCSGRDLTVREFEPHVVLCADGWEPAWGSLSSSLSAPPWLEHALSLSLSLLSLSLSLSLLSK